MNRDSSMLPLVLVVALWAAFPATARDNQLTPTEAAAGWHLLFDGKTMAGWRTTRVSATGNSAWAIDEECLVPQPHAAIVEDLVSKETYRDFELEWDWRISPAGNSGLKYRIQDLVRLNKPPTSKMNIEALVEFSIRERTDSPTAHEYVVGFEYQMLDNLKAADAKYGPIKASASLYTMVPASQDATHAVGEFNHSRLVVQGMHTEHWLNGIKVMDSKMDTPEILAGIAKRWGTASQVYHLLSEQPNKECPISLQNHGNYAWFKNIKIRRIP